MSSRPKVGLLATHPIQYYAPWYRALAREVDLDVYFSHQQNSTGQASAGFDVEFEWDIPLLEGYRSTFLHNRARQPDVNRFFGCVTPEIRRIIRDKAFDAFIVHGWGTASYWQAMFACWRTNTPLLVRGDSSLRTPMAAWRRAAKYPFYRWFIPRFDAYLVVGSRARDYVLHYGGAAEKCFPSPHAVDVDRFAGDADACRPSRSTLRSEFGIQPDATVFLFVGKLIALKRAEMFVKAIANAAAQEPAIAGLIVGDGPSRAEIVRLAAELNAPVRFTGFVNQRAIVRAYVASDVLVVPSAHETWGLVVNEAMACGLPVIASDGVGCTDDLVLDGRTGYVYPVDDLQALTAHLLRLHRQSDERDRLGRQARQRIDAFGIGKAASGTLAAIASLRKDSGDALTSSASAQGVGR